MIADGSSATGSPDTRLLHIQHVSRFYGLVVGINDACLDLPQGGYGLIGPNGSGKTTLLHLINGFLAPSLGTIRVLGLDPTSQRDQLLRRLGYCPAVDGLYSGVSGYQWVVHLLELQGTPRRAARERARDVLCQVGMEHAMDRAMGTYSRGMRQRTKLAQAIAHDPQFLILDEPFNGLDPIARHEITVWLQQWLARGKSLILASHVLHEVEAVTNQFLLICGGRVLASGSAQEVHSLLAGVPNEVRLTCRPREALAQFLVQEQLVDRLEMGSPDDSLRVMTRDPRTLLQRLPRWVQQSGVELTEVDSTDDSLQSLFDKLFRMHRGEL